MNLEKEIEVVAQVLDVLAKNKCSVAEVEAVLHTVTTKVKHSATLHEANYFEELTHELDCPVPPLLQRFSQQ